MTRHRGREGRSSCLWTIGYERLQQGALVEELRAAGVQRLLDVRFRPQSRRAGLSKTRLAAALAEAGIEYEHRRALGTPPGLRVHFKQGRVQEGQAGFRAHVREHHAADLDALARELPGGPRTALLCLEEDPATCHRRVLAEELRARVPGLEVVDL